MPYLLVEAFSIPSESEFNKVEVFGTFAGQGRYSQRRWEWKIALCEALADAADLDMGSYKQQRPSY